ncbi:general substrate transporter [Conidiobolus coronatus NRRL 28638]|uniref:General substrate transporter n=1 Tax=Conidiobolus coronatus (strain ATCC 28846 / CBS 209.66 / NRRL 28638) TaxID=796925 RepID=A0A137P187_CONC2|nr:general substrate transporter [Conidiobolus coronatus NRRL 28638]|eukprot:KXN68639.1 general substrate transporter [Conidiobolus coronatus NRRL 28638]
MSENPDFNGLKSQLTFTLLLSAVIATLTSLQFGYHTGELNTPSAILLNCPVERVGKEVPPFFESCFNLSQFAFSLVTAIFPLGGVLGSVLGAQAMEKFGRKGALLYNNAFLLSGSIAITFSQNALTMFTGRLLVGIAAGIGLVVLPVYLNEISPQTLKGLIGMLNQIGIVSGIILSQVFGILFSSEKYWRYIFMVNIFVSGVQLLLFSRAPESPVYLLTKPNGYIEAEKSLKYLRASGNVDEELSDLQNLNNNPEGYQSLETPQNTVTTEQSLSVKELLSSSYHFPSLVMIMFVHFTQQASGINAIMYFSTDILTPAFPSTAKYITLLINVVQLIVALVSAPYVDKLGRRSLLIASGVLMTVSNILFGLASNAESPYLSALTIFCATGTFSLGLGPLPFILLPEMFDTPSVSSASTLALPTNLFFNFLVGLVFLPLKTLLGGENNTYSGNVFILFGIMLGGCIYVIYKILPETKSQSATTNMKELQANYNQFFRLARS